MEGLQRKLHNKLAPRGGEPRKGRECLAASRGGADPGSNPTSTRTSPRTSPDPRDARGFRVPAPGEGALRGAQKLGFSPLPLFELYENEARYGAIIASIPHLISRYHLNLEEKAE